MPTASLGTKIGTVIHYYNKIKVAIVRLLGPIRVGATVKFQRGDEEFEQQIVSIQIDHEPVTQAKRGQVVGIKVKRKVHEGAIVFSVKAKKGTTKKPSKPAKEPSAPKKKPAAKKGPTPKSR